MSGVHLKTLETIELIFSRIGPQAQTQLDVGVGATVKLRRLHREQLAAAALFFWCIVINNYSSFFWCIIINI